MPASGGGALTSDAILGGPESAPRWHPLDSVSLAVGLVCVADSPVATSRGFETGSDGGYCSSGSTKNAGEVGLGGGEGGTSVGSEQISVGDVSIAR